MKKRAKLILAAVFLLVLCSACQKKETEKKQETSTKEQDYEFSYDGKKITMLQKIEEVTEILGDDYQTFEAASCAVDGMDYFYYYTNYNLTANEIDGEKVLTDLYLKNDTVSTPEGLHLQSDYADVIRLYGQDFTQENKEMIYEKGNTELIIGVVDGKVASIEYSFRQK